MPQLCSTENRDRGANLHGRDRYSGIWGLNIKLDEEKEPGRETVKDGNSNARQIKRYNVGYKKE